MPGVEQEARMGTHAWLLDEKHRWSDVYNWKQCGWCCSGKSRAKCFRRIFIGAAGIPRMRLGILAFSAGEKLGVAPL